MHVDDLWHSNKTDSVWEVQQQGCSLSKSRILFIYFFVIFMTPYQLISNMREHRYQHEINKNENEHSLIQQQTIIYTHYQSKV